MAAKVLLTRVISLCARKKGGRLYVLENDDGQASERDPLPYTESVAGDFQRVCPAARQGYFTHHHGDCCGAQMLLELQYGDTDLQPVAGGDHRAWTGSACASVLAQVPLQSPRKRARYSIIHIHLHVCTPRTPPHRPRAGKPRWTHIITSTEAVRVTVSGGSALVSGADAEKNGTRCIV